MSITLKIVNLIDALRLQNYFVEKEDALEFAPIRISLNEKGLEEKIDGLLKLKGKPYAANEFEKECLRELDF